MAALSNTTWLDRWFPRPRPRSTTKPREMVFTVDENPGLGTSLGLGLQHAILALMMTVYAVIAGQGVGLGGEALRDFIATTILVMAVGTLLQAQGGRFGSGQLAIHIPTPVTLGTFIAVGGTLGIEAAAGGMLVAGVVLLLLSRGLSRLRAIFPPEVTGVVVTMLGLSMVEGGVGRALGLGEAGARSAPDSAAFFVALLTLVVIILLSIWGGSRWRNYAVLIGVAAGYGVSTVLGLESHGGGSTSSGALLGLPIGEIPMPVLILAAAVPILLAEIMSAMDSVGNLLTLDKMNDADWRRADMPMVSRGVFAHGVTVLLSGLTGTHSTGISSAHIGLGFATGVTARRVALFAGLILLPAAFLPQISALIAATPAPVVGAILIYTAGYLIVAGMELVLSRLLNPRRVFVVGLAIVAGTAVMLLPELRHGAPPWAQPLLASALAVATLVAVVLNLLFRVGVRQHATCSVPRNEANRAVQAFVEEQGAMWGARQVVIGRVVHSLGEALEMIQPTLDPDGHPPTLEASFDEFFLEFTLLYDGPPLAMGEETPRADLATLLERSDEHELERALEGLPMLMLQRLADRCHAGKRDGRAYLRLTFEH